MALNQLKQQQQQQQQQQATPTTTTTTSEASGKNTEVVQLDGLPPLVGGATLLLGQPCGDNVGGGVLVQLDGLTGGGGGAREESSSDDSDLDDDSSEVCAIYTTSRQLSWNC